VSYGVRKKRDSPDNQSALRLRSRALRAARRCCGRRRHRGAPAAARSCAPEGGPGCRVRAPALPRARRWPPAGPRNVKLLGRASERHVPTARRAGAACPARPPQRRLRAHAGSARRAFAPRHALWTPRRLSGLCGTGAGRCRSSRVGALASGAPAACAASLVRTKQPCFG
jgi:hypothetical protein